MKLGKTHLAMSLVMVVGSIGYNVWVFTRPANRGALAPSPASLVEGPLPSGPIVTGEQTAVSIDPTAVAPPPDVDLVRAPEWPRNPFMSTSLRRAEVVVAPIAAPVAAPEAETDVTVASILHSPERRLAVVNGRIVRTGDRVGSSTIVEIQPRAIVVESPRGGRRVVALRGAPAAKESR